MDWKHVSELTGAAARRSELAQEPLRLDEGRWRHGYVLRSRHELVFVLKSGEGPRTNTFELGQHGRYRTNVWEYAGVNILKAGRLDEVAMHPTVKPASLSPTGSSIARDGAKSCSTRSPARAPATSPMG